MSICAGLNHRKVMKTDPSQVIPGKLAANLDLLFLTKHSAFNRKMKIDLDASQWLEYFVTSFLFCFCRSLRSDDKLNIKVLRFCLIFFLFVKLCSAFIEFNFVILKPYFNMSTVKTCFLKQCSVLQHHW